MTTAPYVNLSDSSLDVSQLVRPSVRRIRARVVEAIDRWWDGQGEIEQVYVGVGTNRFKIAVLAEHEDEGLLVQDAVRELESTLRDLVPADSEVIARVFTPSSHMAMRLFLYNRPMTDDQWRSAAQFGFQPIDTAG